MSIDVRSVKNKIKLIKTDRMALKLNYVLLVKGVLNENCVVIGNFLSYALWKEVEGVGGKKVCVRVCLYGLCKGKMR